MSSSSPTTSPSSSFHCSGFVSNVSMTWVGGRQHHLNEPRLWFFAAVWGSAEGRGSRRVKWVGQWELLCVGGVTADTWRGMTCVAYCWLWRSKVYVTPRRRGSNGRELMPQHTNNTHTHIFKSHAHTHQISHTHIHTHLSRAGMRWLRGEQLEWRLQWQRWAVTIWRSTCLPASSASSINHLPTIGCQRINMFLFFFFPYSRACTVSTETSSQAQCFSRPPYCCHIRRLSLFPVRLVSPARVRGALIKLWRAISSNSRHHLSVGWQLHLCRRDVEAQGIEGKVEMFGKEVFSVLALSNSLNAG